MKKWMFVIFPGAMLALFLVFYVAELKRSREKERVHKERQEQQLKEEADKKAELEAKARADAEKRTQDRLDEERKKEEDRVAKWNAEGKRIKDDTDKYNAEADTHAKKIAALEAELFRLRALKEKDLTDYLDLAKAVESARIAKRNAELEIQRLTAMIVQRAAASSLTKLPPPPPPPS